MHVLLVIILSTAITIPLISGVVVNLNGLVCSNLPCNQADRNSSLANEKYVSAFINCIDFRNRDYANTQCGSQTTDHVFFCSMKEDNRYCSELINYYTEIPSACSSRSNCTTECKAVLMERFGCCIHFNFSRSRPFHYIPFRLLELQELCGIPISDTCQLALSNAVSQHEFDCPVNNYWTLSNILYNLYCEVFPEDTQQIIDMSLAANCSTLKATGIRYYISCDRTGEERCFNLVNTTFINQFYLFQRQCSTEDICTSECQEVLISLSENLGCCANALLLLPEYNYSSMQLLFDHYYSCSDKMDIWSHCGVSSPGFCDNPLTLNGRQSGGGHNHSSMSSLWIAIGTVIVFGHLLIIAVISMVILLRYQVRSKHGPQEDNSAIQSSIPPE